MANNKECISWDSVGAIRELFNKFPAADYRSEGRFEVRKADDSGLLWFQMVKWNKDGVIIETITREGR